MASPNRIISIGSLVSIVLLVATGATAYQSNKDGIEKNQESLVRIEADLKTQLKESERRVLKNSDENRAMIIDLLSKK